MLGAQGMRLVALIVVSRYLTPAEVAIGGLALAAIGLFHVLAFGGFPQALVRSRELSALTTHTAFVITAAPAIAAVPVVFALRSYTADYFGEPELAPLLVWLSIALLCSATGSVPASLLQRAMRFRTLGLIRVTAELVGGTAAVILAVTGAGYYAMVVPAVVVAAAGALGAFLGSGYVPRLVFSGAEFRKIRAFGFSQLGSSLLRYFNDNSDYLIMSRYWSRASLGQYYFAFERSKVPFNIVYQRMSEALFPAFSRAQHDRKRLQRGYTAAVVEFSAFMFPLYVGVIALADPLVPLTFGRQWSDAVPVFQVFAGIAFMRSLFVPLPALLHALNLAHWDLAINVARLLTVAPTLIVLGAMGVDILETAWALLGLWAVQTPVILAVVMRRLNMPIVSLLRTISEPAIGAVVMAAALLGTRTALAAAGAPLAVELFLAAATALFGYALVARRSTTALARRLRASFSRVGSDDRG